MKSTASKVSSMPCIMEMRTIWQDAVGTSVLRGHIQPATVALGAAIALGVGVDFGIHLVETGRLFFFCFFRLRSLELIS